MKTGFNIVSVDSFASDTPSKKMYQRALIAFDKEYTPADFVKVTEIKHMGTSFDPQSERFTHSFSVSWHYPK